MMLRKIGHDRSRTILAFILPLAFSILAETLRADERWGWNPAQGSLMLGSGIDPTKPNQTLPSPIEHDGIDSIDHGASRMDISMRVLENRRDFEKMCSNSLSISAWYSIFSGSGGVQTLDDFSFHSSSLAWAISASCNYGRSCLKNPRLNKEAKDAEKKGYRTFREKFGTSYVSCEERGVVIVALFSVNQMSEQQRNELRTKISAGIGVPLVGGKFSNEYERALSAAMRNSSISFRLFARGGPGLADLSDVIRSGSDLDRIKSTIADYVGKMNRDNAVPIAYISSSLRPFLDPADDPLTSMNQDDLANVYYAFLECQDNLIGIERILNHRETQFGWVAPSAIDRLILARDNNRSCRKSIRDAARQLQETGNLAHLPELPGEVVWPVCRFLDVAPGIPSPPPFPQAPNGTVFVFGKASGGRLGGVRLFIDGSEVGKAVPPNPNQAILTTGEIYFRPTSSDNDGTYEFAIKASIPRWRDAEFDLEILDKNQQGILRQTFGRGESAGRSFDEGGDWKRSPVPGPRRAGRRR